MDNNHTSAGLWRGVYVCLFVVLAAQLVSLSIQARKTSAASEDLRQRAERSAAIADSIVSGVDLARAAATQAVKNQKEIRAGVAAILKRVDRLDAIGRAGRHQNLRILTQKIEHVQSTADSVQDALPPPKKGRR